MIMILITIIIKWIFDMRDYLFELNVNDLHDSEKVFLWSVREWLLCIRIAKDPIKTLISNLSKCGIQKAVLPLDKIMKKLAYFSTSPIDIRCHCSEALGKNEIDLLCLLSIKQSKKEFELNNFFKYLEKEYLNQLSNNSNKLIECFNSANLYFPLRKDLIASYNMFNKSKNSVIYFDFKTKTLH